MIDHLTSNILKGLKNISNNFKYILTVILIQNESGGFSQNNSLYFDTDTDGVINERATVTTLNTEIDDLQKKYDAEITKLNRTVQDNLSRLQESKSRRTGQIMSQSLPARIRERDMNVEERNGVSSKRNETGKRGSVRDLFDTNTTNTPTDIKGGSTKFNENNLKCSSRRVRMLPFRNYVRQVPMLHRYFVKKMSS